MKQFETGDVVRVKCFNGERRENVVWTAGARLVYLCSRAQFAALVAGRAAAAPIGFPARDVETVIGHEPQAA
jgi:hypothetical protein